LDPFLGSGTTAAIAERYGRTFVGAEASADYRALIARRLDRERQQGVLALQTD
jgi:DNA modification methylase